MSHAHKLGLEAAKDFILGGNSTFTVVSGKTGMRYTFKVWKSKKNDDKPYYVSFLCGDDNNSDYAFIGSIFVQGNNAYKYFCSRNNIDPNSKVNKTFDWLYNEVIMKGDQRNFERIEFWHEGRCGKCGRKLTVPESIKSGFGPTCDSRRAA